MSCTVTLLKPLSIHKEFELQIIKIFLKEIK